jgi:carboxyl-terminal processing protease
MERKAFMHRKIFVLLVLVAVFFVGVRYGEYRVRPSDYVTDVYNTNATTTEAVDFEPFWKAWNTINERYAEAGTTTTAQEKVWGAIEGLANSLGDPYTVFLPPEETEIFEEMISGTFSGVGMEIGEREGILAVIAPLKGTPADRAGIRAGDLIIEIDGASTADLSVDEAVGRIRGKAGTTVSLLLVREGDEEPHTLTLTREEIIVPTLAAELRGDGVFTISLYNFDAHVTEDFDRAMRQFSTSGSDKLIIDLRGNPGGFLDAAVTIAGYFLSSGDVVVRESFENGDERTHRSRGHGFVTRPFATLILVDRGSASASEILAGALREHGVAKLVGEQTFGKGSVQELVRITSDTSLKLTVAQWLTPEGVSISEAGLMPDYAVERTAEDFAEGRDPQLERAVELLAASGL